MQLCTSGIKACTTAGTLAMNEKNKAELMLITSRRTKHLHNLPTSATIKNVEFHFMQSAKNFSFPLHCHFAMNGHVATNAQTCYSQLRCLLSIRRFMTNTATAIHVTAFVLCHDLTIGSHYCSCLLTICQRICNGFRITQLW